jgi:hypothetical protein
LAGEYRVIHRYQIKFMVKETSVGTAIDPLSKKLVGPHVALGGPTKERITLQPEALGGLITQATVLDLGAAPPQPSPFIKQERVDVVIPMRTISSYASARIGPQGQKVNWHLFGLDAPWIFSEIIYALNPDRSVTTKFRTSVDVIWQVGAIAAGTRQFNNLNLYEGRVSQMEGREKRVSLIVQWARCRRREW